MEMYNVLQRLAELDANNPNVDNSAMVNTPIMRPKTVNECGMTPSQPASLNITAASGDEVSGILRDLMTLAGVHEYKPDEIPTEVDTDMDSDFGDMDMAKSLSIIDSLNSDQDKVSDEDAFENAEDERMYANSPEEEIEPHDYGDKQVKPKPQGFKQRFGDNPYKLSGEDDHEKLAEHLMSEYKKFVAESESEEMEETLDSNLSGTLLKSTNIAGKKVSWYRNNDGTDTVYVNNSPVTVKGAAEYPSAQGNAIYQKVLAKLQGQ